MISAALFAAILDDPLPAAAQAEVRTVQQAVAPYHDFDVARRAGWKKFGGDAPLMGEHWYLPPERGGIDYTSNAPLDLTRPSNIMYTWIGNRRVLTGVSFNVRIAPGESVPGGFAGTGDIWHVHDFPSAIAAALQDRPFLRWVATSFAPPHFVGKGDGRGRLAMVHVWTGPIPNPDGVFAHRNRAIPYAKLGLPISYAAGASEAAAKGLNLATPTGCTETIDGALWIANAARQIKRRLHQACALAAAHVRESLVARDKSRINEMGEHGWAMFDAAWNRELSARQRARIAAITEHGPADAAATNAHHHQHD